MRHLLLLVIFLCSFSLFCQVQFEIDEDTIVRDDSLKSINHQLNKSLKAIGTFSKKYQLNVSLDMRRSFFSKNSVKINGLKFSGIIAEKHNVGFGIYYLSPKSKIKVGVDSLDNSSSLVFGYFGLSYGYIIKDKQWYEVLGYMNFGWGNMTLFYTNSLNEKKVYFKEPIFIIEPSVFGKFKPSRWLAFGLGFGYRFTTNNRSELQKEINDFIYYYQININLVEVINCITKKHAWIGYKF